jgi:hypothetical protein
LRRYAAIIGRRGLGIVGEAERANFRRVKQGTSSTDVRVGDEDLNGPEAIHRQTVRVSQRLPALHRRNTGRFQKGADLLRVHFTICDKYTPQLLIHSRTPTKPTYSDAVTVNPHRPDREEAANSAS